MAEILDLKDINNVRRLVSEIEKSEERDRKTDTFDSWQIYSGNQLNYVEQEIMSMRPQSFKSYYVSDTQVTKFAVDKKSKAYKESPKRSIAGNDAKTEKYNEIIEQADARKQDPYLDTVNNLHKYVLQWINYRDDDQMFQFMTLQPYEYSVVFDKDIGVLIGVILNYGNRDITSNANSGDGMDDLIGESQADSAAQTKVYAMWSQKDYVIVKAETSNIEQANGTEIKRSVTYVDNPDNPNNDNVIGVVPFVYVSQEMAIDLPTPNPLAKQAITYNSLASEVLTAAAIQGTGVGVLSYPVSQEGQLKNLTTGITQLAKLPQSAKPEDGATTLSYENPGADLASMAQVTDDYLRAILKGQGLESANGVAGSAQSFSSALEKLLSEAPVQDLVERNQLLYVDMERERFEIVKAWLRFLGDSSFSDEDDLTVMFQKPKLMITDSEILANIEKQLMLGMIEEWEKYLIVDPNMSKEDAMAKLERIEQVKLDKVTKMKETIGGRQGNEEPKLGLEQDTDESEGEDQE